jgi:hypothetical protein
MLGGVVNWDPIVSIAGVLAVLVPLVVVVSRWERRSNEKPYNAAWREVCHVLDDPHVHEGTVLRGSWKGRSFVASAVEYWAGEYAGTVRRYRVSMIPTRPGPAWRMRRADGWALRADRVVIQQRLLDAGLGRVVEEAAMVHVRAGAQLSYDPRIGEVVFEDAVGHPPCPQDFAAHLEMVRRAAEITETEAAAEQPPAGEGPLGLHWRVGTPPVVLLGGVLPAALVALALSEARPWTFALFPAALAAPLIWKVRIGRP